MLVCHRYDQYADAWDTSVTRNIDGQEVRYFHTKKNGVDRVWIDNDAFLAKVSTANRYSYLISRLGWTQVHDIWCHRCGARQAANCMANDLVQTILTTRSALFSSTRQP